LVVTLKNVPTPPELVALTLPPAKVCTWIDWPSLPELFAVALPPPVVTDEKPLAVPELLTVSFWFGPPAVLVKGAAAVPEFVQVMSVEVVVQTNCA